MERILSLLVLFAAFCTPATAQTQTGGPAKDIVERQVAPDLTFIYDETSSNSAFLVTDEGVLVIDSRQHPKDAEDTLQRIRKRTDKPVKWVINTHFHGDHTFGNQVFKAAGATIIAHDDTARIMDKVAQKEFARRQSFFKSRGYDPAQVHQKMPDLTFSQSLSLKLGGREIRLVYLGPGQNPGDTFVVFPHARAVFTPGAYATRSMPNMTFTPSVDSWISLLDKLAAMDVDTIMPPHGDMAKRSDVAELARFLRFEVDMVGAAAKSGMPVDTAIATLDFSPYKGWHNYARRENDVKAIYELVLTGKRSYLDD
jgi:glyoxylase-like metal-dependent hydrolase (beta-lactamase superfamily II)